jgi:hypothetical protein
MTNLYSDFVNKMTVEEAKAFVRKVMGPTRRSLEGKEKEHVWMLLQLVEPTSQSNNQRTWTDVYHLSGKEYHVHYFDEQPEIEEVLKDGNPT